MARVLIVDDNATNLELAAYLLQAFGHEPVTATEGAIGLELARRLAFDLILVDVVMPGFDGYEFVRSWRAGGNSQVPLIALTALAMVGDREGILEAGFDAYLEKPIDPETFVESVEAFLRNPRASFRHLR